VPYPIEEEHFIEWIEAIADDRVIGNSQNPETNQKQSLISCRYY